MKHRSAKPPAGSAPGRTPSPRRRAKAAGRDAADAPQSAKRSPPASGDRLTAELKRLETELETSRLRIRELEALIDVDPLTGTLNRRGFERELRRSLAYVKRYGASAALLFLDLDEFKTVNDRYGHAAGDAVLKAASKSLLRAVRASDVVARIGGDEFVVLLWNIDASDAAAKALVLEAAIGAAKVAWDTGTLSVDASAGVAVLGPADTPAEILARADAAMYARKAERRKRRPRRRGAVSSHRPTASDPAHRRATQ